MRFPGIIYFNLNTDNENHSGEHLILRDKQTSDDTSWAPKQTNKQTEEGTGTARLAAGAPGHFH